MRDAQAGVPDLDAQPTRRGVLVGQGDAAARTIVLDRVGEEVQQDLFETLPVGQDVSLRGTGCLGVQLDVGFGGKGSDQVQRLLYHLVQRHRLERDRNLARFDPGDVQHLADQFEHVVPPLEDLIDALALVWSEGIHFQYLREPEDGVEGGPEFVAHARQKLAFGLVGAVGLLGP